MTKLRLPLIIILIAAIWLAAGAITTVLAAEETAETNPETTATETDPALVPESSEEETPDATPNVPTPDPNEVFGDIQLNPDGQAVLSPEVIQALQDAQQPQKSDEDLRREQWIRIAIDVAIGVGAALVFLAIWWLVKLRKEEKKE